MSQSNPPSTQAAAPPTAEVAASVILERRRFPRELPKPEAIELDSDSAWQAFQACSDGSEESGAAANPAPAP